MIYCDFQNSSAINTCALAKLQLLCALEGLIPCSGLVNALDNFGK
jgi:hypothetical protein